MNPDLQPPSGARDPRQPGPPAGFPPVGPGHIPTQPGYAGPPHHPPLGPTGHPLASFGDRFLAYVIDGLIVGLAAFVLSCPLMFFAFATLLRDGSERNEIQAGTIGWLIASYAAVFVFQFVLSYLYFVEYQLRTGQTVGKRVMSLRVLPISGQPLHRGILGRRYLVQFIAGGFVPFFSFLDGLWQLWDQPLQQTLHDKAAETVVAKVVQ